MAPARGLRARLERIVDATVGVISPKAGLERKQWRDMSTAWEAADKGRPLSDWSGTLGSPDTDLFGELPEIRARSRELHRNNVFAASATESLAGNIVGTGLLPQARVNFARIPGLDEDAAREIGEDAEEIFDEWSRQGSASADGRLSFFRLQELAFSQVMMNGDVLALPPMVKRVGRKLETCIDLIEADRIDDPRGSAYPTGKHIRFGVELGERSEPTAYWVANAHPNELYPSPQVPRKFTRFPAESPTGRVSAIHLYRMLRPGQTRGVPVLAPAMKMFKHLSGYLDAEVIGAKVAACYAAFIVRPNATQAARMLATGQGPQGEREQRLDYGAIYYTEPGEDVRFGSPNRPGATFDMFFDRILLSIGASLGLPYELIARDFRKTNYSSARAALLEARRMFQSRQKWFAEAFCQVVWELVLEEAWLTGLWKTPGVDFYEHRSSLTACKWTAPTWGLIDPKMEIEAYSMAVDRGFMTGQDVVQTTSGGSFDDNLVVLAREQRRIEELEVAVDGAASKQAADAAKAEAMAKQAEQQGQQKKENPNNQLPVDDDEDAKKGGKPGG